MSMINTELQEGIEQPLAELCNKLNRSRSWIINEAKKEFLENHQSHEEQRWQETLSALASVKNGNSIAGEKVESWLAGWGSSQEQPAPRQHGRVHFMHQRYAEHSLGVAFMS